MQSSCKHFENWPLLKNSIMSKLAKDYTTGEEVTSYKESREEYNNTEHVINANSEELQSAFP